MKVSAIVVTYNRVKTLKNCLHHLLKQSRALDYIVVINNNSIDGTKKYLDTIHDKHFIIKNMKRNVGGAGGFSVGLKLAFEHTDSNLFWIMDDDTVPTKNALGKLVSSANKLKNNFGFLCSNVRIYNNNKPCNMPNIDKKDWSILLPSNLIKIRTATFVSYMIPRYIIQKLGLPIASMFIWGDDYEYSLRLSNYEPCYFVSDSIVLHNSSSSNTSMFNMDPRRDIYLKYDFRNELYAIRKHGSVKDVILKIIKELFYITKVPFVSKHTKCRKIIYMLSGFIQGFFFNPKVNFPRIDRNNSEGE